ncbi:MAG: hypothetical protein JEZ06_23915 [Anaerolineaceae bacterium]|nr:hypothetical protein [Anaerolineaceae bacterium]
MNNFKIRKTLTLLCGVIMAIPLGVYTYLGTFTRYWADDYCYGALLNYFGFWKVQSFYLGLTPYAQNRYALTFFSGLLEPLGVLGMRLLPGVFLILWVLALAFAIKQFSKILNYEMPSFANFVLAEIIVAFVIYLAPNQFQILYWRSGLLPYTAPIVTLTFLTALLLRQSIQDTVDRWSWPLIILLALIAGGFSEIGAAFQLAFLSILLLINEYFLKKQGKETKDGNRLILAAIYSAALALILVVVSPANYLRQSGYGEPAGLGVLIAKSLEFTLDFIWLSFRGLPIPFAVIFLLVFSQGYLFSKVEIQWKKASQWGSILLHIAAIVLICFVLILVCFAPSVYIEKNPPAERALLIPLYVLILSTTLLAWIVGQYTAAVFKQFKLNWTFWIIAASFLILLAYPLHMADKEIGELHQFQKRADVWDVRTQKIIDAREAGQKQVEIRQIDSYYMGGIAELLPDPGYWINGCAAEYYGVSELSATIPW